MKLTSLLIFIFSSTLLAGTSYSQNTIVSLDLKNVSMQTVFHEIEKQSDYSFFYNSEQIDLNKKIDIQASDTKISDILNNLFSNSDIAYKVIDKHIVLISMKAYNDQLIADKTAQQNKVTGVVTDEITGEPLIGVSVSVEGSGTGTITDAEGKFSIEVPDQNSVLVFSYMGYLSRKLAVGTQNNLEVKLQTDVKRLEEVVVIGYGSQKKKDITSAIATVNTSDISSRPIVSVAEALMSKAPGVQVVAPSGKPGNDLSIRVRGIGSPNGNEPLYVIDGVLATDTKSLDPNNIASISVLKDASAAGIYGAAGSTNGVVLITTKQGIKGKKTVDVDVYSGWQEITKKIDVLNTPQWKSLITEIFGTTPVLPAGYSYDTNNDWQNLVYRKAKMTGVNLGFSGGGDNGTYYFGLGYLNQDGIVVNNNFTRYSLKLNLDQNMNKWLNVGTHLNYNRTNSKDVSDNTSVESGGVVLGALTTPPWIPVKITLNDSNVYDPNGYSVYGYNPLKSGDNPLSSIYRSSNLTVDNILLGDVYAEIKLPLDFKYRTQFGGNVESSNYDYFLDPFNNLYGRSKKGIGTNSTFEKLRWSWDNTLTWSKIITDHSFNIVLGSSAVDEKISQGSQSAQNFATNIIPTLNAGTDNKTVYSAKYEWTTYSYFARLLYSFKDKYLLTGTLRNDNSSRVGSNFRGRTFPAASVGWRVSQEEFMKDVKVIQNLKLRFGYGTSGNLPPYTNLYPSVTPLSQSNSSYVFGSTVVSGVTPGSQVGNPDLKWESAKQTNVGFDVSFWKEKITLSVDYYHKKVTDMIFPNTLSQSFGNTITVLNLPGYDMNKGLEVNVDASFVRTKDFEWSSNFNISFNKNYIGGLDSAFTKPTGAVYIGGSTAPLYTSVIKNGYSLGTFWGYVDEGVDPATGNIKFSPNMTDLGSALPKFSFGFSNEFRFKNISLSVLLDGISGNKVYNATRMEIEAMNGYNNQSTAVLNRWQKSGDITDVPRALDNALGNAANASTNNQVSSRFVEDGSFLRIRNLTLAYMVNTKAMHKYLPISGLKVYVSVQNLATFTKYKGYYPEVNASGGGSNNNLYYSGVASTTGQGSYNNPYNASANSTPSPISLGIDDGTYPQARIFTFGLNVQL
ncbi:MAG TPA: TonB-dependent receptor [Bacteroidales bacterium]